MIAAAAAYSRLRLRRRSSSSIVTSRATVMARKGPDYRFQIGKAARERIKRNDVAVTGRGQRRKAEIKHRSEATRAGCDRRQIGKSVGDQLPDEAERRRKDHRQA